MSRTSFKIPICFSSEGEETSCDVCAQDIFGDIFNISKPGYRVAEYEICGACYITEKESCDLCSDDILSEDANWIKGEKESICPTCYNDEVISCDSCDTEIYKDNSTNVNSDDYCRHCLRNETFHCDGCNERYPNDFYGGDSYCQSCYVPPGTLASSETKNPNDFIGDGPLYLGVELEVECPYDDDIAEAAEDTQNKLGYTFLLKEDGSITDGFEIVSAPADLANHLKMWDKFFNNPSTLIEVTSGCGMHVHVSRKALSRLDIGKLIYFLNSTDNKWFVEFIAGRYNNTYCEKLTDCDIWKTAKNGNEDRYRMINMQNPNTIEFRIFESTLNIKEFKARLEFVASLCEWVEFTSLQLLSASNFINFIRKTTKYPHLSDYIANSNLAYAFK